MAIPVAGRLPLESARGGASPRLPGLDKEYLAGVPQISEIAIWDDTLLVPGQLWLNKIQTQFRSARAALLLISQKYLISRFIREVELPLLLEAQKEGLLIWTLFLTPSTVRNYSDIMQFASLNNPDTPLSSFNGVHARGVELVRITEIIHRALTKD